MKKSICFLIFLILITSPVFAGIGFGGQIGVTDTPSQLTVGMRAGLVNIVEGLNIVGIMDFGFGEEFISIRFMGDLQYQLLPGKAINPYIGVGLDLYANIDDEEEAIGVSIPAGVYILDFVFVEGRIGFKDSPEIGVCVGILL